MVTIAEEGLKGNKKGRPIWTVVKRTSLAMSLVGFLFTTILVLDAFRFVSVRVSIISMLLGTFVMWMRVATK